MPKKPWKVTVTNKKTNEKKELFIITRASSEQKFMSELVSGYPQGQYILSNPCQVTEQEYLSYRKNIAKEMKKRGY